MTDWDSCPGVQCDADVLEGYQEDASGLVGTPDGVIRARDQREVAEVMEWAWNHHGFVTPVGGRTSTTGSASPTEGGLVLSLEGIKGVEFTGPSTVRVGSGMYLGDLKRQLSQEGWLYPPDPTSENDCTIGGSVATNASGPRSLKYGPTRHYVRGLEVVLPTGETRSYRRRELEKDTTGYGGGDPGHCYCRGATACAIPSRCAVLLCVFPGPGVSFGWRHVAQASNGQSRTAPRAMGSN